MQKTTLLFITSVFISFTAFAQISKGALLIGGDFSALTAKQKSGNESSNSGISVSPLMGKAIRENLVIGGSLSIGYDKSKTTSNFKTTHNAYGTGLFLRKYKNFSSNFYGFIQGGADVFFEKYTYKDNGILDNKNRLTRGSINLSPGLSFKLSKKLHLETGFRQIVAITYQHQKINDFNSGTNTESISNSFSIYSSLNNFTSNLYLGFRLLLDKK